MVKNKKQMSLAEKTEQILLVMPRMIATQIGKDLLVLSQQAKKLNFEHKKYQIQGKKLADKIIFLKRKNTALSKKQLGLAQKALKKNQQVLLTLIQEGELIKKQTQSLSKKKAKYSALQAQILNFQKEWDKKAVKKTKKRRIAALKATRQQPQETHQMITIIDAPREEEAEYAQEETIEKVS